MERTGIVREANGRRILMQTSAAVATSPPGKALTRPDRVVLPSTCVEDACTEREQAVLIRFTEASEMAKGNMAVAILGGEPRGRYAAYADRVGIREYSGFEIDAYRWIIGTAFGNQLAHVAELIANMNGERIELDFIQFGGHVVNSKDERVSLGGAIGAARAAAWALLDAYRDYYKMWQERERRAKATAGVAKAYRPALKAGGH